jgi:hypothetical protein
MISSKLIKISIITILTLLIFLITGILYSSNLSNIGSQGFNQSVLNNSSNELKLEPITHQLYMRADSSISDDLFYLTVLIPRRSCSTCVDEVIGFLNLISDTTPEFLDVYYVSKIDDYNPKKRGLNVDYTLIENVNEKLQFKRIDQYLEIQNPVGILHRSDGEILRIIETVVGDPEKTEQSYSSVARLLNNQVDNNG